MKDSKAARLAAALNDFLETSPNAEAAAVVSFDGLTMASALPPDIDEERMGAMSAALLGLGEQAALGLGRGELHQLFVEGDDGFVFLMSARDQAVLAVVTDHAAKIGFVLYEMRHTAGVIGAILLGADADVDPSHVAGSAFHEDLPGDPEDLPGDPENLPGDYEDLPGDYGPGDHSPGNHSPGNHSPGDDSEVRTSYDHPVAQVHELDEASDARVEHEIVWPPADESPYEPGPIPDDLQQNPYYLVSRAPESTE